MTDTPHDKMDAREHLILFAARDAIKGALASVGKPKRMDRIDMVLQFLNENASFQVLERAVSDSGAPTVCEVCPNKIRYPRPNKRFCSTKCRMRYHRVKKLSRSIVSDDSQGDHGSRDD